MLLLSKIVQLIMFCRTFSIRQTDCEADDLHERRHLIDQYQIVQDGTALCVCRNLSSLLLVCKLLQRKLMWMPATTLFRIMSMTPGAKAPRLERLPSEIS